MHTAVASLRCRSGLSTSELCRACSLHYMYGIARVLDGSLCQQVSQQQL